MGKGGKDPRTKKHEIIEMSSGGGLYHRQKEKILGSKTKKILSRVVLTKKTAKKTKK